MRHVIVNRVVLSLAVLFAAAVAIFTWGVTRPVEPPRAAEAAPGPGGAELFERHCAMCHEDEEAEIAYDYREAPDRAAASAALRDFLVDHHGPSPRGNARIAEYLLAAEEPW